jgi:hypothetical protein
MAAFNSTLFFIVFQLVFVISARAEFRDITAWSFTPAGEVTLCDADPNTIESDSDDPIQLAQFSSGYCVCAGQAAPPTWVHGGTRVDGGQVYCSPGAGWTKLYPIVSVEHCPNRVNRYRPPADGCGSKISGTGWVAQSYLNIVPIDDAVCGPHDRRYSDCQTSKQFADDQWRRDSVSICSAYFPGDPDKPWENDLRNGCIEFTDMYHRVFVAGGGKSWDAAQKEACQCGPYSPCMGGQAQGCINCPPMQQGYFFPLLPLSFPPTGGCSPGDDFC